MPAGLRRCSAMGTHKLECLPTCLAGSKAGKNMSNTTFSVERTPSGNLFFKVSNNDYPPNVAYITSAEGSGLADVLKDPESFQVGSDTKVIFKIEY